MNVARPLGINWKSVMPDPIPIVFVVGDDVSVLESLELLIQNEGSQPETFASHRNSSIARGLFFRAASSLVGTT